MEKSIFPEGLKPDIMQSNIADKRISKTTNLVKMIDLPKKYKKWRFVQTIPQ